MEHEGWRISFSNHESAPLEEWCSEPNLWLWYDDVAAVEKAEAIAAVTATEALDEEVKPSSPQLRASSRR